MILRELCRHLREGIDNRVRARKIRRMNSLSIADRTGLATIVFASREVGSRYATKVRIRSGAFAGRDGMVVEVHHAASVAVRFTGGLVLPFGPSELEAR